MENFYESNHKPEQLTPSPVKPTLQVQKKDPYVLVQVASAWQLCVSNVHSLLSESQEEMF